jgi:hypothetical protein
MSFQNVSAWQRNAAGRCRVTQNGLSLVSPVVGDQPWYRFWQQPVPTKCKPLETVAFKAELYRCQNSQLIPKTKIIFKTKFNDPYLFSDDRNRCGDVPQPAGARMLKIKVSFLLYGFQF